MGPGIYWKCWTYAFNVQQRPLDVYLPKPNAASHARLDDGLPQNEISDVLELLKSRVVERGRGISTPVGAEETAKRQQALISTVAHLSASDRGGQGASGRCGTTSGWVSSVQAARAFDGIGRRLGGQAVRRQPCSRRSAVCHPGEFLASAAV